MLNTLRSLWTTRSDGRKLIPLIGVLVAMTIALSGCATMDPKTGGNTTTSTYDDAAEVAKGSDQHKRIVERFGIYQDKELSEYVAAVGSKLAAVSERPALKWQFTVLDSAKPTAFAVRGGYVYITRGMLAVPQSAIVQGDGVARIFVQRTPEAYEFREVTTGKRAGQSIEIVQGLKEGDRIVIKGGDKMPRK